MFEKYFYNFEEEEENYMYIKRLIIKNYKLFRDVTIDLNPKMNIFVGNNDSGKSTLLEIISIITTGKLNGYSLDKQIKPSFFNIDSKEQYMNEIKNGNYINPPEIVLEAYFDDDQSSEFIGTNNVNFENQAGIHVEISLSSNNEEIYKDMIKNDEIVDIPVELYDISFHYFSGSIVLYRRLPISSLFVDTTRKDYSNVITNFIFKNITDYLTEEQQKNVENAYRIAKNQFQNNNNIKELNDFLKDKKILDDKNYSFTIKEETVDEWKKQMSITVDDIPFENLGFGTQNFIKIELAVNSNAKDVSILMLEEPENNLSFSNMALLISHLVKNKNSQVFISTHSSYIANKLNLENLLLVNDGKVVSYSTLNVETKNYFAKLPGYDTLRFILSEKVILVEGPSDDLIIQRAYKDMTGKLPIEDGIDIIVVDALAFKRYLDIAKITNKSISVVTDNDGNIEDNIENKYKKYINDDLFKFFYEKDQNLNTLEPSVLKVNCFNNEPTKKFKEIISKNNSNINKNYKEILTFMLNNKPEWALRVFDSDNCIEYPEYIKNVIEQFR